eukprot:m.281133 g.281133  ORF g.281133 m.281133 type:complete len:606 (+) comp16329_c0_seq5:268-2085(+)
MMSENTNITVLLSVTLDVKDIKELQTTLVKQRIANLTLETATYKEQGAVLEVAKEDDKQQGHRHCTLKLSSECSTKLKEESNGIAIPFTENHLNLLKTVCLKAARYITVHLWKLGEPYIPDPLSSDGKGFVRSPMYALNAILGHATCISMMRSETLSVSDIQHLLKIMSVPHNPNLEQSIKEYIKENALASLLMEIQSLNQHLASRKKGKVSLLHPLAQQTGSPWVQALIDAAEIVEQRKAIVSQLYAVLHPVVPIRAKLMFSHVPYLFMMDKLSHPTSDRLLYSVCNETSVLGSVKENSGSSNPAEATSINFSTLSDDDLQSLPGDTSKSDFLGVHLEKGCMWGCWFLSQYLVNQMFSINDINQIGKERVQLGQQYAWSTPTNAAIHLLQNSPLVEIGAGNALWASKVSSDVSMVVFDTPTWSGKFNKDDTQRIDGEKLVNQIFLPSQSENGTDSRLVQLGGPEMAAKYPNSTLVLMWPDYMGGGNYGLECLTQYTGNTLITVGEWWGGPRGHIQECLQQNPVEIVCHGQHKQDISKMPKSFCKCGYVYATLEDYGPGIPQTGQSFSASFQDYVREQFNLVTVQELPTFPLFADVMLLWQRKTT